MAPRVNKRQAREEAEAAELAQLQSEAAGVESAEESENDEVPTAKGGFEALNAEAEEDEEEEAEPIVQEKTKKPKSKKKKNKGSRATESSEPTPTKSPKATKAAVKQEEEMDEFDRALAELALQDKLAGKSPSSSTSADSPSRNTDPRFKKLREIYAFDPKFLDADAELRRMFGSKVIATTTTAPRSNQHARFANNVHHPTSLRRTASMLVNPEPGWVPLAANRGGVSIARYDGPESKGNDGEWWTIVHSQTYKEGQLGFLEVLQQADGNRLYDILESHPYSVDTLMQLSEMAAQQGDLGASSTHLSKALYALSACMPPSFPTGAFRLPYSQIENRAFYLGVARKVSILVKRGTWRTACEWAKIALGAAGDADPVGMLTFIDFLAPKAKQEKWFLSLLEDLPSIYPGMAIGSYPGLAYAKALCLRNIEEDASENNEKSTAALRSAILTFPMVVPLLYSTLGGNLPPKMVGHRRAQVDGAFTANPSYLLSLLSELYVVRSSPLWKEPTTLAWLHKTVNAVAPSLDDSTSVDVKRGEKLWTEGPWPKGFAPAGVIRAAYISEIPSIRPYLPPSVLSGTSYSYDPLPPSKSDPNATFYDDAYFAALYGEGTNRRNTRRAAGPANPGMAAAMMQQFAELMGLVQQQALAPELRDELLDELEQLGGRIREEQGVRAIPGGFPGAEGDEEAEGDEAAPAQGADLLGWLAGALGRGRAAPAERNDE